MVLDPLDPRIRVQILMQRQLEYRTPSVPRDDDRAGEEIHPNPVPLLSVRFDHPGLIGHPVPVPPEESGGVVDAQDIDVLHLESGVFDLGDDPRETARGICSGEDPTVHVETPAGCDTKGQFVPMRRNRAFCKWLTKRDPRIASWGGTLRLGIRKCHYRLRGHKPDARKQHSGEHRHAKTEKSHSANKPEYGEGGIPKRMSYLGHFQAHNLGIFPFFPRQIAIIAILDPCPPRIPTACQNSLVPKGRLVMAEGDT